jgi:hypothetical protein
VNGFSGHSSDYNTLNPDNNSFNTPGTAGTPADCVYTEAAWTACSTSCGEGTQTLTRTISEPGRYGGAPCPAETETKSCTLVVCPIDCKQEPWNEWSACSLSCGGEGSQHRERNTVIAPEKGGKQCEVSRQTQACNENNVCEVHCEMSAWSAWDGCTKSCGSGFKTQTRSQITAATGTGLACGRASHTTSCNTQPCPVDCIVGGTASDPATGLDSSVAGAGWSDWSSCTAKCDGGIQTRTRKIEQFAQWGGVACAGDSEQRVCNTQSCAVNCETSHWSDWSTCGQTCGSGTRTRARVELRAASADGIQCPHLDETQDCESPACPVDCVVAAWPATASIVWSACTVSCGVGTQQASRVATTQPTNGMMMTRTCAEEAGTPYLLNCPVDCVANPWGPFGTCKSVADGSDLACRAGPNADGTAVAASDNTKGIQTRTATRNIALQYGGTDCTAAQLTDTQPCDPGPCAVHCTMSAWTVTGNAGDYGDCSAACGVGTKTRTRTVAQIEQWAGHVCASHIETDECMTQPCPSDCEYTAWSPYSSCSMSCGAGTQTRLRDITRAAVSSGTACDNASLSQDRNCNDGACPTDCEVSAWSDYGDCSVTCGKGTRAKTRSMTTAASTDGAVCPSLEVVQYCNEQSCEQDCEYSAWSTPGTCSNSCGAGVAVMTRTITKVNQHGGACAALEQTVQCSPSGSAGTFDVNCVAGTDCGTVFSAACPVDCVIDYTQDWGDCLKDGAVVTCGYGQQTKARPFITDVSNGGMACPPLSVTRSCANTACPVDCTTTLQGTWGTCSQTCGSGIQIRSKAINTIQAWGGHVCPELEESRACMEVECPVDCKYYELGLWGECSSSCGTGTQHKTRSIYQNPSGGGAACPDLTATQACDMGNCPIHCEVSAWSTWTICSSSCGIGQQAHTRTVDIASQHGGNICPILSETRQCLGAPCPVDCVLTATWADVGACTQTCSSEGSVGYQNQEKRIVRPASFGGATCAAAGAVFQTVECGATACPIDCVLSQWGYWGDCTVSCGVGTYTRSRSEVVAAVGGAACSSDTVQTDMCDAGPCPIDCEFTESGWGACSTDCGEGTQTMTRTITSPVIGAGQVCPATTEQRQCPNAAVCNVDCVMSDYSGFGSCSNSCGPGRQSASRQVTTFPTGTGAACPVTENTIFQDCNEGDCDRDCITQNLGYGLCSEPCGGGTQTENVHITSDLVAGGAACYTAATQACNQQACTSANLKHGVSASREVAQGTVSRDYVVTYTTGTAQYSASQSPQYIQLHGSKGSTPFMTLGNDFVAGVTASKTLSTDYEIGLLYSISLKAGGSDAWNTVNFIDVATPTGNSVQFATDYFLTDDASTPANYMPYQSGNDVDIRAVNAEEGTPAASKTYSVTYRTSTVAGSDSANRNFIQLTGTKGASNFYSLGDSFTLGATVTTTITTNNHIGLLKEITLEAGGDDDWHPLGYVSVQCPSTQTIDFWTDLTLTSGVASETTPHTYYREQIEAVTWETKTSFVTDYKSSDANNQQPEQGVAPSGAEHDAQGTPIVLNDQTNDATTPPTTAAAFDQAAVDYDHGVTGDVGVGATHDQTAWEAAFAKNGDAGNSNAGSAEATPVSLLQCTRGSATVPSGWVGSDAGANYCNKCECDDSSYTCTARVCGRPWHGLAVPAGAGVCSLTTCSYAGSGFNSGVSSAGHIEVQHKSAEANGVEHRCAYNQHTSACQCFCWGTADVYATTLNAIATVPVGACTYVPFTTGFDALKGTVKVVATLTSAGRVNIKNPSMAGFEACVTAAAGADVAVDFYAYQGSNQGKFGLAPFGGAQSGVQTFSAAGCATVQYAADFGQTPVIVGSSSVGQYWIENVNTNQFKVCAEGDFTWIAFEHKNPSLWIENNLPYTNAGSVAATGACQAITFASALTGTPNVQLLANHKDATSSDFAGSSAATSSYAKDVTATGFTACTTGPTTGLVYDYATLN